MLDGDIMNKWIEEEEVKEEEKGKINISKGKINISKGKKKNNKEEEEVGVPMKEKEGYREIDDWFADSTHQLINFINRKGKVGKEDVKEAALRSKKLSTSSDVVGVKFTGAAFQLNYFQSKFSRRGRLLFDVIEQCMIKEEFRKNIIEIPRVYNESILNVASYGGGPGCDSAGLVWAKRKLFDNEINLINCTLYDYEKSWKKYVGILQEIFNKDVNLSFSPNDVTKGKDESEVNKDVHFENFHLHIFSYGNKAPLNS